MKNGKMPDDAARDQWKINKKYKGEVIKKSVGKPRHSEEEIKESYSIRMTPSLKKKIIKEFGNLSLGVPIICETWNGLEDSIKILEAKIKELES